MKYIIKRLYNIIYQIYKENVSISWIKDFMKSILFFYDIKVLTLYIFI